MQTHQLIAHPSSAPASVQSVEARIGLAGPWLQLRWRVEGAGQVILPPFTGRQRTDGLWQTTCFEMFLWDLHSANYCEINLSPSESWAAYDFSGVRRGMREREMSHDPVITPRGSRNLLFFDAAIPLADFPPLPLRYSLTCVIEEEGGNKSYWAASHGLPDKPDFHDPSCFAGTLEPTEQS